MQVTEVGIGLINSRRLITPGAEGWARSVRPGVRDRYFMVTADSHANEPTDVYQLGGIDTKYLPRVPHMEADGEGRQFLIIEGWPDPQLVKGRPKDEAFAQNWDRENLASVGQMWSERMEPDDLDRMRVAATNNADRLGLERMHQDCDRDGVDAAVVFPNKGLLSFATYDAQFSDAMCRAWNTWAWEIYKDHLDRFKPMALIQTSDLDLAIAEARRCAALGYPGFNIPAAAWLEPRSPYNDPRYDALWAVLEEIGRPVCIHVATGRDPRAAKGNGGAVLNFALGAMTQVVEPLAYILASGVFERFPRLRIGTIEGGVGWVPWLLETLDDIFYKHHMWVRPWLKQPPSAYYRTNSFSTFQEDHSGLRAMRDLDMLDNVVWGNDYPHMEGSWPHSAEALERQLGGLTEDERAKLLGLNAARIFGFDPAKPRAALAA
jgi:predicted TIM-barrel fold metal-dependent hydrolase